VLPAVVSTKKAEAVATETATRDPAATASRFLVIGVRVVADRLLLLLAIIAYRRKSFRLLHSENSAMDQSIASMGLLYR
jgi:hypothetical protein